MSHNYFLIKRNEYRRNPTISIGIWSLDRAKIIVWIFQKFRESRTAWFCLPFSYYRENWLPGTDLGGPSIPVEDDLDNDDDTISICTTTSEIDLDFELVKAISHRLWVIDVLFVRFQNRFLNTKIFTWIFVDFWLVIFFAHQR